MEQQGTVNNRTFVVLNFRSIILALTIREYPQNSYGQKYGTFTYLHVLDPGILQIPIEPTGDGHGPTDPHTGCCWVFGKRSLFFLKAKDLRVNYTFWARHIHLSTFKMEA